MKFAHQNALVTQFYGFADQIRASLCCDAKCDLVSVSEKYITHESALATAQRIKESTPSDARIVATSASELNILWPEGIISISKSGSVLSVSNGVATISIMASPDIVQPIIHSLENRYAKFAQSQLELWFKTKDGPRSVDLTMEKHGEYIPELYPWIEPDYFERYLESDASIIFLSGEPGTGKTSLLRHEIVSRGLSVVATYDEDVLSSDDMFIDFVSSKTDIMVIEDADDILLSRTKAKNDLIPRFLNFSDGLAKFPHKKIIFTTNLRDFSGVDEALIRKGRCFGSVTARALTISEAAAAARAVGIKDPECSCTLAELLHPTEGARIKRALALA